MKVRPRVLITTDIDWASDWLLESFFDRLFTLVPNALAFSTHDSKILKYYSAKGILDIGVHPNFRNHSTHGSNTRSVSSFVGKLFSTHKIYRSHGFVDSPAIRTEMRKHGYVYESNILKYNEPGLKSEKLLEGLTRLPCFWSDGWSLRDREITDKMICKDSIKKTQFFLAQPGLKVINIHPILFVNNCFSLEHYNEFRNQAESFSNEDYKKFKNSTRLGTYDYFKDMIDTIASHCDFCSIEDFMQ